MMKLTFLIIITLLALMMPLLWITGTMTSIIYFLRNRAGTIGKGRPVAMNPQLGLTMADGGAPLDETGNGSVAVKQADITDPSPGSPGRVVEKPITGKMFWWGGYY